MAGYRTDFLAVPVALPTLGPSLAGDVLVQPALRDGIFADYENYTVVMHRERRAPIYAALNIDQEGLHSVPRRGGWEVDTRIGAPHQLDNDYYRHNPWDRGHLARRAAAAWGVSRRDAQRASDDTFFYPNAALQHHNFNQDEWLALEEWVLALELDRDGKLSVFTGPIYGLTARSLTPSGRPTALIPSAFFKVVCFIDEAQRLAVRAFVMTQDAEALRDRRGRRLFDFQNYQVAVMDIEALTGLRFEDAVPAANPLFFNDESGRAPAELPPEQLPERIEVDSPGEIVGPESPRTVVADEVVDVFVAAALVDAVGDERAGEWISIINLTAATVDLDGWHLSDTKRPARRLTGSLGPGEAVRVQPLAPLALANAGGVIELFHADGRRVDRVKYGAREAGAGKPVIFAYREGG